MWRRLTLMRRMGADPRLPKRAKIVFFLATVYILSPIDLIPDFIPGLGYLDDVVVAGFLLWLFFRLVPAELVNSHRAALEAELSLGRASPESP